MKDREEHSLEDVQKMLSIMKQGSDWFKAASIKPPYHSNPDLDGYRNAVTKVEQGLSEISESLEIPKHVPVTGEFMVHQGHRRSWFYRWLERSILCQQCKKLPGTNATTSTLQDGPMRLDGPIGFRTPASQLSDRHVCDTCLAELEGQGAQFSKRRLWVLSLSQLWEYKGIPAFVLTLTSLVVAIVALIR